MAPVKGELTGLVGMKKAVDGRFGEQQPTEGQEPGRAGRLRFVTEIASNKADYAQGLGRLRPDRRR